MRSGDILLWRSTTLFDMVSENIFMLKSFHAGLILTGKSFESFSACGRSPSDTYITFRVDKIYPIEEVVGQIWFRPNATSLYLIHRCDGRDISEEEAYRTIIKYFELDKCGFESTIHLAIVAYFRKGEFMADPVRTKNRYHLCSVLIGHILSEWGLLREDAVITNLLPIDFYGIRFYQKYRYKRIKLFDKRTYTYRWLFTAMLERLGQLKFDPIDNTFIENFLQGYSYPRDPELLSN